VRRKKVIKSVKKNSFLKFKEQFLLKSHHRKMKNRKNKFKKRLFPSEKAEGITAVSQNGKLFSSLMFNFRNNVYL
jgi:hypothetical protein